jgi:flagellar assembly protein FliH
MPIIKAAQSPSSLRAFSMADIEAHARKILLKAQQQAEAFLVEAQAAAEVLKAEAYAQGLAEGKKQGIVQGKIEGEKTGEQKAFDAEKARLSEVIATLISATEVLNQKRAELVDRADAEVLPLALCIARKVTRRLGALDPRVVEANMKEAVRLVVNKHTIHIAVHPSQLQHIDSVSAVLKMQWPQLQHIAMIEDTTIAPGGCRVRTAGGDIDADLESQLDRIARELVPESQSQTEAEASYP